VADRVEREDDTKVLEVIKEITRTRTQSIRVCLIEKNGKPMVSIQKWWRKSADEDWKEGKGFHLDKEEVNQVNEGFNKALEML
jgi:hypothetical protein